MADTPDLEEQLRTLTKRFEDLHAHVISPPKPHWSKRIFTWETLKNLMVIVGIPVALLGAWEVADQQYLRYDEIKKQSRMQTATAHLGELQQFNADVYTQQALQQPEAAFALLDAKRGRVERLTRDIYAVWQSYPADFTRSELTTLAEGLMTIDQNDKSLEVVATIDQTGFTPIWLGDMDILKARVLFARGPAQDPEAAREAFKDAMRHADEIDDPGLAAGLVEKFVAVRLVNELWLGTPCDELVPFAGYLTDAMADGTRPDQADAVRVNTYAVMEAHTRLCTAS